MVRLRVVIYIRVSTLGQAVDGYSLAAQERELREYCAAMGYEVVFVYVDEGVSGKDIKHRPALVKLLEDAKAGSFDAVVIWKLTRLTRSLKDLCHICEVLQRYGIALISRTESFDTGTPTGRMLLHVLGTIAEFERATVAENVLMAMAERAKQGKPTCARILGYDYTPDGLKINTAEAEIVRFIFSEYLRTGSLSETSRACVQRGYIGKNGGALGPESVSVILGNFTYCGFGRFQRTPYPATHEAIISTATYNAVQRARSDQDKHTGRRRVHNLVLLPDDEEKTNL